MENINAEQARNQLNPQKISDKQIEQYKIIQKNIKYIYRSINRELKKNNNEAVVKIGYYGGFLITNKYWYNDFGELSDESEDIILDYFINKGFDAYYEGFYVYSDAYITVSWDVSSRRRRPFNPENLKKYLEYIGENDD